MISLIFILQVLLFMKFPPGANLEWSFAGGRRRFPIGYFLAASLFLTMILKVFNITP